MAVYFLNLDSFDMLRSLLSRVFAINEQSGEQSRHFFFFFNKMQFLVHEWKEERRATRFPDYLSRRILMNSAIKQTIATHSCVFRARARALARLSFARGSLARYLIFPARVMQGN